MLLAPLVKYDAMHEAKGELLASGPTQGRADGFTVLSNALSL